MAGLKLTPIILKEVNKYLTTPKKVRKFGFDDTTVKTGEDIERPQKALDREMFKDAEERFNKADGGRIGFSTAGIVKKLLKEIPDYRADEKDRTAAKKFMKEFLEYSQKKFSGNFKAAAESIGESREKIRGIFDRVRLSETGTRKGADVGKGTIKQTIIPTPKNVIPYKEATTKVKTDKTFLKDKIKNFDGKKFYNAKDIANILGVDASNKNLLDRITGDLLRFDVTSRPTTGAQKEYNLKDAVNKITKGYQKKKVKRQTTAASRRNDIELKLDPELKRFFGNFINKTRNISISEGIYVPGAVEDVGHPLSIKITSKYPNLIKNSNINKINTLTFQDPILNREVLLKTGYEGRHDALLSRLNKLLGKKIGSKELQELQSIKNKMNDLHTQAVNQTKNLAKQNKYFLGQETRIPKIDINIPKQGETFKSENLFVDMSNVNPAFKVGLVDDINPNAKFFKDLSNKQKEIYKRNVLDQTKFNLDKFYTKAGFPKEQINELKDSLEFGTADKIGIATAGTLFGTAAAADDNSQSTGFTTGEKAAGAAAAGSLAIKPVRKAALKTAAAALGPVAATYPILGFDVKNPIDRLILGAELAGAPSLVKASLSATDKIKNPLLRKAAQSITVGSPKLALRLARAASPIGIASLAGEGLYQAGKFTKKRIEELQAMSPEQRRALRARQAAFAFEGAREGGIIGKKSGPPPVSGPMPHGLPYETKGVKKQ